MDLSLGSRALTGGLHFRGVGPGPVTSGLAAPFPAGVTLPTHASWAPSSP